MNDDDIDIMALASAARRKGYDVPERIIEHLRKIIKRNITHINKPYRQGRGFNEVLEEDSEVFAYIVVLIETWAEEGK